MLHFFSHAMHIGSTRIVTAKKPFFLLLKLLFFPINTDQSILGVWALRIVLTN